MKLFRHQKRKHRNGKNQKNNLKIASELMFWRLWFKIIKCITKERWISFVIFGNVENPYQAKLG